MKKSKTPGKTRKQRRTKSTHDREDMGVDHFGATYRAAMATIHDLGVKIDLEAILTHARTVAEMEEDQGSRLYAEAAKYLLKHARQSSGVCDALVRIVAHWPRRKMWVPLYCLAFDVVGDMIVGERLSPDQETLVVRGMVENWLRMLRATDDAESCPAIPEEIIENMNWPLWWLRRRKPAVLLRECYYQLCANPESYDGIDSLLDGLNEKEDAIMATWLKSKHCAPKRLASELDCGNWAIRRSMNAHTEDEEEEAYEEEDEESEEEEEEETE